MNRKCISDHQHKAQYHIKLWPHLNHTPLSTITHFSRFPKELAAGVFSCGTHGCVCTFSLQNLIKNLPEQKELSNLAELKNEYEELCESEQFGIVVSTEILK